ncbi:MAG: tetratricopeptide repeat protein [Chloroflexi bacterium]|nr:tetratricopeptide repeat protein [Chloroflexota bacterium]
MSANSNPLLEQAIAFARQGRREQAQALLNQVLEAEPGNVGAWLWLATVAETDAERIEALQQVLRHEPGNATAREALEKLGGEPPPLVGEITEPGGDEPLPEWLSKDEAPAAQNQADAGWLSRTEIILVLIAVIFGVLLVIGALLIREATQDDEPTAEVVVEATDTFTPRPTFTPSISPTPRPTSTPPPAFTLPPAATPTDTLTVTPTRIPRPTFTRIPTRTPFSIADANDRQIRVFGG